MKPMMPKPSNQLILSAAASVLALSALALSTGGSRDHGHGGGSLMSLQAGIELPGLPALPSLIPS